MMSVFKFGGGSNGAQTLGSFISRTPSLLGPYHTTKRDENHKLQRISNLKFLFLFLFFGKNIYCDDNVLGRRCTKHFANKIPFNLFFFKKIQPKKEREREREKERKKKILF